MRTWGNNILWTVDLIYEWPIQRMDSPLAYAIDQTTPPPSHAMEGRVGSPALNGRAQNHFANIGTLELFLVFARTSFVQRICDKGCASGGVSPSPLFDRETNRNDGAVFQRGCRAAIVAFVASLSCISCTTPQNETVSQ